MDANLLSLGLMLDREPEVIDNLNNGQGTFLYNHNIEEVLVIEDEMGGETLTDDEELATKKAYKYDSVRVEYPKTADNIFATLLTAKYPANVESKLINEYQCAQMGLLPESAADAYVAYLKDRLAIRAMVDADCAKFNIPTDMPA